jgi:hypothetical protein
MSRILANRETGRLRGAAATAAILRNPQRAANWNRTEATAIALAALRNMTDDQKRQWKNRIARHYSFPNYPNGLRNRWASKALLYIRAIRNGGSNVVHNGVIRNFVVPYNNGTINWKTAMNTIIDQVRLHSEFNEPYNNNPNFPPICNMTRQWHLRCATAARRNAKRRRGGSVSGNSNLNNNNLRSRSRRGNSNSNS